jgi:glucans biosynthesis protein C
VSNRLPPAAPGDGRDRILFIDNIRWTMIVLVLSMHACVTYSPFGSWFYRERAPMSFASLIGFAVYQSVLQAFFMALLFFIAGYFAAASYDRKGAARFIRDRLYRLGLPTIAFMLLIGPLTEYFVSGTWGQGGFVHQWLRHVGNGEILSETGPLWFCAALLIFCTIYAGLRWAGLVEPRLAPVGGLGSSVVTAAFVAAMALATFAVRVVFPSGSAVLNMQLANFSQYILAFAAGTLAYRGAWLRTLRGGFCAVWGISATVLGTLLFAALFFWGGARHGAMAAYSGGFNWVSAGMGLWEAIVCVGVSLALIAGFRRWFNEQGRAARWMSDNAFGVYVIHPPILIGLALLLHEVALPPLSKAALLTLCAAAVCFGLAAPLLRRTPMLRAIA